MTFVDQPTIDPGDFLQRELSSANARAITSLDDNPDEAARANDLAQTTGASPALVYGDLDHFENQHKVAVTSAILNNNPDLQAYVNSHPLAAKISNDDYGQLDTVSDHIRQLTGSTILGRYLGLPQSVFGAAFSGFKEGFGSEPVGSWIGDSAFGKEYRERYPYSAFLLSLEGGAFEIPSRVFTGGISALKSVISAATGNEQAARDIAGMVEQQAMGLTGVHMPVPVAEAEAGIRTIEPYAKAGKEPLVGIHPVVDAIKAEQAEADKEALSEALKESVASKTRERAPGLYQNFISQITSGEIGISADAVRELYGNKVPQPNDGILGWVPKIDDQLAIANDSGADIRVPLADWLAKVEPDVAKALEDHIRVRDGGVTVEEAKELPESESIGEPVHDLRRANGLEPEQAITIREEPQGSDSSIHDIRLVDAEGNELGALAIAEESGGKRLYVDNFEAGEGPNALGAKAIRSILGQIKAKFLNAESIEGIRVSGAREQAEVESGEARPANELKAKVDLTKVRPRQLELPQDATTRMEDREAFAKASAIGMTVDQYKRYQKLIEKRAAEDEAATSKRILEAQRKRQTAEWKANRAELRPQVEEEMSSRPDHELDQMIRDGLKLREDSLTPEQKSALPKNYIAKDGIHPDDLAGLFGSATGREIVDQLTRLIATRKASGLGPKEFFKKVVDAETDSRMETLYGDLDKNIIEEAKDQVLSETQQEMLHEQLLARAAEAGLQFSLTKEEIEAAIKAHFDKLSLRQISSDRFLADSGRAYREANKALLKDDPAEAFRQEQRGYHSFILAREAKKLEKQMDQFDKLAKRFSAREVSSVDQDYTNWVHDILLRVGQRVKRSIQDLQDTIAKSEQKTLSDFVDHKEIYGMREVPVAEFLLNPDFRRDLKNLSAEEFRAVNDSVKTLVANGRDEKKIIKAGEEADLAEVRAEMIEQLSQFKEKQYDASGDRKLGPLPARVGRYIRTYLVSHLQLESIFNRWDRGDPKGVFTQYVSRELATAANSEAALERKYARLLGAVADKADLKERVPNQVWMDPLSNQPIIFTRKSLRAILLNAGNASNWDKITRGYKIDPEVARAWLNDNATKEDWDWAQKVGAIFAEIKKEADVMARNLSGIEPESIKIDSIDTPHGKYNGWYYPVIFHPVWEGSSRRLMGPDALEQDNYHRATTPKGYTKQRTGYAAPMALDLDMMPVRMRQMLHDIAFRPAVIQASKIFYDKDIRAAVTKHVGAEYTKMLVPYLRDVANAANYRDDIQSTFAKFSETIRQNIIATLVGLNPGTVLKHGPTAAMNSITEVGAKEFLKAAKGLLSINESTGESNWRFAMDTSEELQRRHRFYQETLGGAQSALEDKASLRDTIIRIGSYPVAMSDLLSAVPTWMAKYTSEMEEHGIHGDAVYEADRAVRRAHGSSVITNRPAIMRSGPLASWVTSLYGFFNHILNRQYEMAWRAGDALDLVKSGDYNGAMAEGAKVTGMFFSYVIFPALIEELVTPYTNEEKDSWGKKAAKSLAYSVSSSWIGIRDIVSAIVNGRDPSIGLLTTTYKTASDMARDFGKDRPLSKQHAGAIIQHSAAAIGAATGMMPQQVGRVGRFLYNVQTGQEKPKGPWGWLVGLRYGTLKNHSQTFEQYKRGK